MRSAEEWIEAGLAQHRGGDLAGAEAAYRAALSGAPGHPEALQLLGVLALARGQAETACDWLAQALAARPEAAHIAGNYLEALLRAGRGGVALRVAQEGCARHPQSTRFWSGLARAQALAGDWDGARQTLAQLERLDPADLRAPAAVAEAAGRQGAWAVAADLWRQLLPRTGQPGVVLCNLGDALLQQGDVANAEAVLRQSVDVAPDLAPAWHNLGLARHAAGQPEAACAALARACALDAESLPSWLAWAEYWMAWAARGARAPEALTAGLARLAPRDPRGGLLLARLADQAGQGAEARRWWRQVVAQHASAAEAGEAWSNLGAQALDEGDPAEAGRCLNAALSLVPGSGAAWFNLGLCRHQQDDYAGAVDAYARALALGGEGAPWCAQAYGNLGRAYFDLGDLATARRNLEQAGAARSAQPECFGNYVDVLLREADWAALDALLGAAPDWPERVNPFTALALSDDPEYLRRSARAWSARQVPSVPVPAPPRPRRSGPRLRIGYLSSDLHDHATARLLVDVLEHHDPRRFEVTLYSYGPDDGSPMRARLRQCGARWVDLAGQSARQMAAAIRRDGLDLLIDLKGHTHRARLEVLAWRPAPVQATWLGFPGTLGCAAVDVAIVDGFVAPPGAEAGFDERLLRLPRCYQPADSRQTVAGAGTRADWGLPDEGGVLACFNQIYKLNETTWKSWLAIIAATPGAVLWLLDPGPLARARLDARWRACGLPPERLVWAPVCPHPEHLGRLRHADLVLDTFPYGAHTTASDALRQGVPVLTRVGRGFPSRVAGSLLHHLGLTGLICDSEAEFIARGCALAGDAGALAAARGAVRAALPRLEDTPGWTADFEQALRHLLGA